MGSSRITVRDPAAKAIATESFLFMPPLNVSTAQCLFVGSPTSITSLLGKKGGYMFNSFTPSVAEVSFTREVGLGFILRDLFAA